MQHGGWMAEPRRADHLNDDHLNEDAPAGPHVRTSQLVATSGRCGRTSSEKRARERGKQTREPDCASQLGPDWPLSWQCHSSRGAAAAEQPSEAAVARIIIADDNHLFPARVGRWGGRADWVGTRGHPVAQFTPRN